MKPLSKNVIIALLAVIVLGVVFSAYSVNGTKPTEVSVGELAGRVQAGDVVAIDVEGDTLTAELTDGNKMKTATQGSGTVEELLVSYGVTADELKSAGITVKTNTLGGYIIGYILPSLLPIVLLMVLFFFMLKQMQGANNKAMSFGQSGAREFSEKKQQVKFADVAGALEAKEELSEIVEFLKNPKKFSDLGAKIPKGVLLMGPPGTGKTLLTRAVAGEAEVPFYYISGSEFVEMFVGVGASRVRDLFAKAKKSAPCIIFIDEIDAVGRQRGSGLGGSHDEREQTLNQILTEMDGFEPNLGVIVIAATNRPDVLDPALLRAGRFERKIYVTRPNLKEREQLFHFYLKKIKTSDDVNAEMLARKTLWFSPADIDNMVREAGLLALRDKRDIITFRDLSKAYDRILYGEKSNTILSEKEKEWVSYHESGHAIIGYLLHPTNDVIKATIIPHKGALGFVAPRPKEEVNIRSKEWYLAEIKVSVASYAAERIKFGTTGSGVSGDFQSAVSTARQMVWNWGMGKSGMLGDLGMSNSLYHPPALSERTKEKLDDDVQEILNSCLQEVSDILTQHRDLLDVFAKELFDKGELEYDEIQAIFDKAGLKPHNRPLA